MTEILISIKPEWIDKIRKGEKTIEVRTTMPNCLLPIKVNMYCTKAAPTIYSETEGSLIGFGFDGKTINPTIAFEPLNGKVVGSFILNKIEPFTTDYRRDTKRTEEILDEACLSLDEAMNYESNKRAGCLFAWHISDLIIYDYARDLGEYCSACAKPKADSCEGCKHLVAGGRLTDYGDFSMHDTYCELTEPIERAPQSWRYVRNRNEL